MAEGRSGRGLAALALLIALIALGISLLAYQQAGGMRALQAQVQSLQGALEDARRETADALQRLERAVRPSETPREDAAGPRP